MARRRSALPPLHAPANPVSRSFLVNPGFVDFAHVLFGKPVSTSPEHALARRHLGDLDLDPERDLAERAIEAIVPRAALEAAGDGLGLAQRDLGQNAAEQGDLELVERIERETAALDPLLAPLGRFSSPCRAMSASMMPPAVRSAAGALAAPRRFPLAQAEGARGRAAPGRGGGDGGIRVRSGNAHVSCVSRPLPEADPGASSAGRGVREPRRSWRTRR